MKRNQAFPSQYLGKDDLPHPVVATIDHVTTEEVQNDGGKEEKRCLHFRETIKPCILNGARWDAVAELSGIDDDDEWGGVRVELYVDPNVKFGNKKVGGIAIRKPSVAQSAPSSNGDLAEAKRIAWASFKSIHKGEPEDVIKAKLPAAVQAYFGDQATPQTLTAAQWKELVQNRFRRLEDAAKEIFGGEGIPAEDIPF